MIKMNAMGFIRGYLSKNCNNEDFMILVGEGIEQQLKEWDEAYEVNIMKFKDYVFVVKNGATCYEVFISESLLAELQEQSPFSLDQKIWLDLEGQGLEIVMGYGDYLMKVLGRE